MLPNLSAYGRWLAEAAVQRSQGRPFVLLGHSLGGSVVLHAEAHLRQQKQAGLMGVVLLAAGGGIYQPRPFRRLRSFGRLILELRPDALGQLPPPFGTLGPFRAERRAAQGLLINSTSRGAVRELPGLVADLEVDSLWISGDNDQVMEPGYVRHLAAYSPAHDYRQIAGCGHLPMREKPEILSDILSDWIEAQSLARPRS
jgi:2-succinyl-6-hydroxy-2,4-cyclohexadiene-1-carboxylate synthase